MWKCDNKFTSGSPNIGNVTFSPEKLLKTKRLGVERTYKAASSASEERKTNVHRVESVVCSSRLIFFLSLFKTLVLFQLSSTVHICQFVWKIACFLHFARVFCEGEDIYNWQENLVFFCEISILPYIRVYTEVKFTHIPWGQKYDSVLFNSAL